MRVALLSFSARRGDAIGNQVAEKLLFFLERGAEVRVCLEQDRPVHPQVRAYCQRVAHPATEGECWSYLRDCDLVIAEYGQFYSLLELLPTLSVQRPRIIVDYHGVTPPELWGEHNAEPLAEGVRRRDLLHFADGVVVHSRYTYDEVVKNVGVPANRVWRTPYPLALPDSEHQPSRQSWRERLQLANANLLLYVGRLAPNKNVPLLVEATAKLCERDPSVHLLIAGDDSDLYQMQADFCRQRAQHFGIAERVHLLGPQIDESLHDLYRCADVFVTASGWESFCIPVAEAMHFGLPVIAARNSALPDTIGDAGLTFSTGSAAALAQQIRRVLDSRHARPSGPVGRGQRVLIIDGTANRTTINGATVSLAKMANALSRIGPEVEFWHVASADKLPAQLERSITCVPFVNARHDERNAIEGSEGIAGAQDSIATALPRSPALVKCLKDCGHEFGAILVGPYLSNVTFESARCFPEKTILVPCFHDEEEARLDYWRSSYENCAGFLFHSEDEKILAQSYLGYNHPNNVVAGTFLSPVSVVDPQERATVNDRRRTIVYCGRRTEEKNLPLLLEFAARYCAEQPNRFHFRFMGEGNIPIPDAMWAENLGIVSQDEKTQVLAGADALVNLSCNESLSLAALEAWQCATPVIAHASCPVLAAHVRAATGGELVADYPEFAAALDDLWINPRQWRQKGSAGQKYVQQHYADESVFAARLLSAIENISKPLFTHLQEKGRQRTAAFDRELWRSHFSEFVEEVLDREGAPSETLVEVRQRTAELTVAVGRQNMLIPVLLRNWGTTAARAQGPDSLLLRAFVLAESTETLISRHEISLPRTLLPGETASAVIPVDVPADLGDYLIRVRALPQMDKRGHCLLPNCADDRFAAGIHLTVTDQPVAHLGSCHVLLNNVRNDLEDAARLRRLPEDYLDVTQGLLANVKKRIKHKLLNNFKSAYVDVLSRRQSSFNQQILSMIEELARCCELLDHAVSNLQNGRGAENIQDDPVGVAE